MNDLSLSIILMLILENVTIVKRSRILNQIMFLFIMLTIIFIIENEMNLGMSIRAYIKMRLISAVYPIHCSG